YFLMMTKKLGLDRFRPEDQELIVSLENTLADIKPDMTIFYQLLAELPLQVETIQKVEDHFRECFYNPLKKREAEALFQVITRYIERLNLNSISRVESKEMMRKSNPRFILRNYL